MSRKRALIGAAVLAVLAGALALALKKQPVAGDSAPAAKTPQQAANSEGTQPPTVFVNLYFPGVGGWLQAERRELPASAAVEERITVLVEALLAGPTTTGMHSPLPEDITLRRVYLNDEGRVFLDLESPDGAPPEPSGSSREILTVYSLVDTVLLNLDEAQDLVLLWNGRQLRTFAGHLDTMRPLAANTDLIVRAAE